VAVCFITVEDNFVSTTKGRLALILVFGLLYVPFLTTHFFQMLDQQNVDLPSFYFAADVTFNHHASPYQPNCWMDLQDQLEQKVFPYLYPPPSLLFFWPLSWFSYPVAKTTMLVLNHLSLLFLLYLLFFHVFRPPWSLKSTPRDDTNFLPWLVLPVMLLYTLQFNPIAVTLNHGQVNLIVMVQICLFWIWLREGKPPALTALPLALAIILKTYPAIFLPLLLIRRQYLAAAWALGYTVTVTLVSFVVLPHGTWGDWMNSVLPTGGYGKIPFYLFSPAIPWNQSLNGFTARLILNPDYALTVDSAPARWVPTILAGLILGALVWVSLRMNRRSRQNYRDEEIVLVLLSLFLVAPLSWEHHLVFVLPAALLALKHLLEGRLTVAVAIPVGLAICVLAWPLTYVFQIRDEGALSLLISLKTYATVGLWVYFLVRLWRSRPVDQPARG
jgi:alpha-1,2-mannosyltransferase